MIHPLQFYHLYNSNGASMTDWISSIGTAVASITAIGFGIWNTLNIRREKIQGLSLRTIDAVGNGVIENKSRVDYEIELSKAVLGDGTIGDNRSLELHRILSSDDEVETKRDAILSRIGKFRTLISRQTIAPEEAIGFHIHSMRAEDIRIIFILLRLNKNSKLRYYLYRFSYRGNAGHTPVELHDSSEPFNEWVRVFSFDQ